MADMGAIGYIDVDRYELMIDGAVGPFKIEGTVTDADGNPAERYITAFPRSSPSTPIVTISRPDGSYELAAMSDCPHTVIGHDARAGSLPALVFDNVIPDPHDA